MDEKKIIQALECCANGHCACCPYFRYINGTCREQLASDALELVKKQREEINELTGKHWNEAGQIARYSDELNQFADIGKMYSEIKAEIIKDFAEKLKSKICFIRGTVDRYDIDNLVKEMTGGDENA